MFVIVKVELPGDKDLSQGVICIWLSRSGSLHGALDSLTSTAPPQSGRW